MIESPQHHGDLLRLVAKLRAMRAVDPTKSADCDRLLAKLGPHVDLPSLPTRPAPAACEWPAASLSAVGAASAPPYHSVCR